MKQQRARRPTTEELYWASMGEQEDTEARYWASMTGESQIKALEQQGDREPPGLPF